MVDLSIIIPVYNAEKYLEECIDSVLKQTLDAIEIICIDDGSTDSSFSILKRFEKESKKVKVLTQKNQGAGPARNLGLQYAKGEYIFFLDSDDYLLDKNSLKSILDIAVSNRYQICGGFRCLDDKGKIIPFYLHRYVHNTNGQIIKYSAYQGDYYYQNYVYSKKMLVENNITFPNYRRFQDPPFLVKAMYYAEEFCVLPVELYCYRVGHQQIKFDCDKGRDFLMGLADNIEFSAKNNLKKLHLLTFYRLNYIYTDLFIKNTFSKDLKTIELLWKINFMIRWDWTRELFGKNQLINPLIAIEKTKKNDEFQLRNMDFPYDKIKPDSKIVLYGAGEIGIRYWNEIAENKYAEIVLWVDKNYTKMREAGYHVQDINTVKEIEFDYMIIAMGNIEFVLDVAEWTANEKIGFHKIVWPPA